MQFPQYRMRRLRQSESMRELVKETRLSTKDFIYPLFVVPGTQQKNEVSSMPGVYQFSIDMLEPEIKELRDLGIRSVILFGLPEHKDECGSSAFDADGPVQRAIAEIHRVDPNMVVVTDVCMCEYTSHGHCGALNASGDVINDDTLRLLQKEAVSHAQAGADIVAPSDMMDGRIAAIREALDEAGFSNVPIMAYSAKFCSAFYGPFRDAADSAPQKGNRRSYQMDPANAREALREVELDIQENADFVMVKPALSYMDIIYRVKSQFNFPTVSYNVSGEYSMVKAAAQQGWIDESAVVMELLTSLKRAGSDLIITYHAKDAARWMFKEVHSSHTQAKRCVREES